LLEDQILHLQEEVLPLVQISKVGKRIRFELRSTRIEINLYENQTFSSDELVPKKIRIPFDRGWNSAYSRRIFTFGTNFWTRKKINRQLRSTCIVINQYQKQILSSRELVPNIIRIPFDRWWNSTSSTTSSHLEHISEVGNKSVISYRPHASWWINIKERIPLSI
jgi:hypothetical protein